MIKVAVVGPESTGKSALCRQLAMQTHGTWVREFAREYLENLSGNYNLEDIVEISKGQIGLEDEAFNERWPIVFCDTNLLVTKIWAEYKFGICPDYIEENFQSRVYDLILLCNTDLPWEPDPLREHPHARTELFNLYRNTLKKYQLPYFEVAGIGEERWQNALAIIHTQLKI